MKRFGLHAYTWTCPFRCKDLFTTYSQENQGSFALSFLYCDADYCFSVVIAKNAVFFSVHGRRGKHLFFSLQPSCFWMMFFFTANSQVEKWTRDFQAGKRALRPQDSCVGFFLNLIWNIFHKCGNSDWCDELPWWLLKPALPFCYCKAWNFDNATTVLITETIVTYWVLYLQIGIPNSRLRYFLIARLHSEPFSFLAPGKVRLPFHH